MVIPRQLFTLIHATKMIIEGLAEVIVVAMASATPEMIERTSVGIDYRLDVC